LKSILTHGPLANLVARQRKLEAELAEADADAAEARAASLEARAADEAAQVDAAINGKAAPAHLGKRAKEAADKAESTATRARILRTAFDRLGAETAAAKEQAQAQLYEEARAEHEALVSKMVAAAQTFADLVQEEAALRRAYNDAGGGRQLVALPVPQELTPVYGYSDGRVHLLHRWRQLAQARGYTWPAKAGAVR